jgi:hypothetical protein
MSPCFEKSTAAGVFRLISPWLPLRFLYLRVVYICFVSDNMRLDGPSLLLTRIRMMLSYMYILDFLLALLPLALESM